MMKSHQPMKTGRPGHHLAVIRFSLVRPNARPPEHASHGRGVHPDDYFLQHDNVGLDLFAAEDVTAEEIFSGNGFYIYKAVVPTGIKFALPRGYHLRIASRSGLWFNKNIEAFPGTIDSSYRGEVLVSLKQYSRSPEPFQIFAGQKCAQAIVFRSLNYTLKQVGSIDAFRTSRGEKGFGSTDNG